MRKEKGITLVALVITIVILIILAGISISTLMGEDGIIKKAKEAKENIIIAGEEEAKQLNQLYYELEIGGELTDGEESIKKDEMIELLESQVDKLQKQVSELQTENDNLNEEINDLNEQITELEGEIADLKTQVEDDDIEIADLLNQVNDKQATIDSLQSQLDSLNATLAETTATADKILKGYTAYSGGQLITGSMTNNGAVSKTLNAGASYTIPAGYHNGSGKVTANSLASQTSATATAADILSGKTAWVSGTKLTGTNKGYDAGYTAGYNAMQTSLNPTQVGYGASGNFPSSLTVTIPTGANKCLLVLTSGTRSTEVTSITGTNSATITSLATADMECDVWSYIVTCSGNGTVITISVKNDYYTDFAWAVAYKLY